MTPPDPENRPPAPDRLHLQMRPPSPKTHERPPMSTAAFTFVDVVSLLSAVAVLLGLPFFVYAWWQAIPSDE